MRENSIIRVQHDADNPFFMMSRATAQDELSFEALGVLTYLLSKPTDWEVVPYDIMKHGDIGKDKCMRIFDELEEKRYMVIERNLKYENGWNAPNRYTIHEVPQSENPSVGNPQVENPPLTYTDTEHKKEKIPSRAATRDRSYMSLDINRPTPVASASSPDGILNSELVKYVINQCGKSVLINKKLQDDLSSRVKVQVGNTTVIYDSPVELFERDATYREFVAERVKMFSNIPSGSKPQDILKNITRMGSPPIDESGAKRWPGYHYWIKDRQVHVDDTPRVVDYGAPNEIQDDTD